MYNVFMQNTVITIRGVEVNLTPKQISNFWSKVTVKKDDECWLWKGALNKGYGWVKINGKTLGAHSVSWMIKNGELQPELFCCHKCDVPNCVNPNHLFVGTPKDNMTDMISKGRQDYTKCRKGENHVCAKLTTNQVLKLRHDFTGKKINYSAIGRQFNVRGETIKRILERKKWSHI